MRLLFIREYNECTFLAALFPAVVQYLEEQHRQSSSVLPRLCRQLRSSYQSKVDALGVDTLQLFISKILHGKGKLLYVRTLQPNPKPEVQSGYNYMPDSEVKF